MRIVKVPGKNKKHRVLMYAISTCAWCKRAKRLLRDSDIEYEYIDVDQCNSEGREKITLDILRRGGRLSYPTMIIDDKILITGYQEAKIKEALDL